MVNVTFFSFDEVFESYFIYLSLSCSSCLHIIYFLKLGSDVNRHKDNEKLHDIELKRCLII